MTSSDILSAIFSAGLPLFLLTLVLVAWALHRDLLSGETVKELQGSIDALGKAQKDRKRRQQINPALGKWFRFGGGFYGLAALYTWLLIEWDDVVNFLVGLKDIVINLDPSALLGLVIDLVVESFLNFAWAIAWPAYWLSQSRNAWIMFFVGYAGYWLGIKAAQYAWQQGWVSAVIVRATGLIQRSD